MEWTFKKKINFGFGLAVLIIIVFASYAIYITSENEKARKWTRQAYLVIENLKDINFQIKDLEIYKQRFLFTGEERAFRLYYEKIGEILNMIQNLKKRANFLDNKNQEKRLSELEKLLESKLVCDNKCMEVRKRKGFSAAMKEMLSNEENDFVLEAIILIDVLEEQERFSLYERQDHESFYSRIITIFIVLGSPFTVFLFIILIYVINNDIKLRSIKEYELQTLSLTDELTGLYNRRGFIYLGNQKFNQANKENKRIYLYFIDMDGLKKINDSLGHKAGDEAIMALSELLKQSFRLSDLIARMGGDEFAVIVVDDHVSSETIINRLNKKVREFNQTGLHNFQLSFSIGFQEYDPSSPTTIEEMLKVADERMYKNKLESRKNREA